MTDYEVVIAGLGPVGAALANLLAKRGHAVLVVEQSDLAHTNPRAISIDDFSLRMLQKARLRM